jgi:dTDP-3-amino-3,4,6-trideoxy-alpha-D-glucose transaminase
MTATIPFVDLLADQTELGAELESAVTRVVASGRYLLGPELERFEQEFAEYCGTRYCVGVGSGLSAIELALRAAGIGPGDEVIVPAYTWIATWLAVSRTGARPVGVDVEAETYNIDPSLIAAAISERTAAIVPVHLRGEPADMDAIDEIARAHGLAVIEDAAQAHGARHRGRRVGGLGVAGAFSFYPSKNLGTYGDGGVVTTDDEELAAQVRLLRNYGMKNRYEIEATGVNSRLAEIQAAVLRVKLPRLDAWNAARQRLAAVYRGGLAGRDPIVLPETSAWADPVWHLFVINHPERDRCARALREAGVETLVHYPLLPHLSPPYRDPAQGPGTFPVAEGLATTTLSLPMFPQLESDQCEKVAEALIDRSASGLPPPRKPRLQ